MLEKIKELMTKIEIDKKSLQDLVINYASTLPKIEAILFMTSSSAFDIGQTPKDIFTKHLKLYKESINEKYSIVDVTYLETTERYQTFYISSLIEKIDYLFQKDSSVFTIFTNRSNDRTYSINKEEFVDGIYDFIVSTKLIGFIIDN